jgi:hypothetical protein
VSEGVMEYGSVCSAVSRQLFDTRVIVNLINHVIYLIIDSCD